MKLVVISESYDIFYCISKALKNVRIIQAKNNLEAVNLLRNERDIDFVLVDFDLKDQAVFEFFHRVDKNFLDLNMHVYVMANECDLTCKETLIQHGYTGVLVKCQHPEIFYENFKPHLEIIKLKKKLETNLAHQHSLFTTVYEQAPIGIAIGNKQKIDGKNQGIFLDFNNAFLKITRRKKEFLIQEGWEPITHPDDIEKNRRLYQDFYDGKTTGFHIEKRYLSPDNQIIWVLMDVTSLHTNETSSTFLCLIQDITYRKLTEQALMESERSKSVLLSNLPGMAYRCKIDREWTMEYVSSGVFDLTGYRPSELIDNQSLAFNDLIVSDYRQFLWEKWQVTIANKEPFEFEYEITKKDQSIIWVLEKGEVIYQEETPVALEGIIIDITKRKNIEKHLKYLSEHDTLTGLYDREYLSVVLENSKHDTKQNNALLIINFSRINTLSLSYGFSFSEQIIRDLSMKVQEVVKNKHDVYYVSFERMAVYIKEYESVQYLKQCALSIISACTQLDVTKLIGCNIGIVRMDTCDCDCTPDRMIRNASIASEEHMHSTSSITFFDQEINHMIQRQSSIKDQLIQFINQPDDSMILHFQPIICTKDNKVSGFEALCRFSFDGLGYVSPAEFIPLAEETQIIILLGEMIIDQALAFKKTCDYHGYQDISISINVSTLQLLKDDFSEILLTKIKQAKIDPTKVIVELTESVFSDKFMMINSIIQQLRKQGVKIAIDDFGTGYSNFARERELKVDTIKLDKRFIDRIEQYKESQLVSHHIIQMAHKLDYSVVAEGVETKKQLTYLKKHQCDYIQGYYYSKPVSFDQALSFLKNTNG